MTTFSAKPALFPAITKTMIISALIAGVLADITWEIWARGITPLIIGGPLEPSALVQSVFGLQSHVLAELIHLVVGVVFYPLGYLFIARPLQRAILPGLPMILTALGFGVGLWIFSLYVMAHLFAGLPAFLGFGPITWVSLVGHLLFGLVVAVVLHRRGV
ncbi:hypothetical protein [Falsirhodobacter sp. alg1]|uniref:hypothetical protein n=1 Tax=Falsirhodobacter sp. alg1 TaxID=1472418 RepID=UPI0005ED76DC|nr:hypothetical protein [Falsirhodobacter sp. alg1]